MPRGPERLLVLGGFHVAKLVRYYFYNLLQVSLTRQIFFLHQGPVAQSLSGISGSFNCYHLFMVKGGFFTRLRFKENKFGIYNFTGPQFCRKTHLFGSIKSD